MSAQNEFGAITHLLVKSADAAFESEHALQSAWRELGYSAPPDLARARAEYERFVALLRAPGTLVHELPRAENTGLDSIYVRDATVVSERGVVLCRMGKSQRRGEPAAQESALRALGVPILGAIREPGTLEGGDVVWLGERTLAVGRGYRTNDAGIAQLRALLAPTLDELIVVALPHWRGEKDVFHLMSIVSPVDRDLAVVYAPLLPVPFREALLARGITLVEVPDEEFESMGANVLALAPRRCLTLRGNPRTRSLLEAAGATVLEYEGREISLKGGGGPTCLTRPLHRKLDAAL